MYVVVRLLLKFESELVLRLSTTNGQPIRQSVALVMALQPHACSPVTPNKVSIDLVMALLAGN